MRPASERCYKYYEKILANQKTASHKSPQGTIVKSKVQREGGKW